MAVPPAYVQDNDFTLYVGDALTVLRELPDESVHMCCTSPPYWGLRDYGTAGQIGLEATPELFVESMVAVFREVRRVLRADGTLWLNLGDSYANDTKWGGTTGGKHAEGLHAAGGLGRGTGLKAKDMVGIPWRVAFALQADGWYLRSDIVWSKPNPMPESVTDRPTKAHEYVFLLTKSPRYFFDQEAVREQFETTHAPGRKVNATDHYGAGNGGNGGLSGQLAAVKARLHDRGQDTLDASLPPEAECGPDGRRATAVKGGDGSLQHRDGERWPNGGRNIRSVWEIATQPYPQAHFATFPEALPERCIKAGTSERGCCPECGAAWVRETSTKYETRGRTTNGPRSLAQRHETAGFSIRLEKVVDTLGWVPSCGCNSIPPVPCTVLDPFMGSGTTALVARKLGRKSIGIELSPEYAALCARRLQQLSLFGGEAA